MSKLLERLEEIIKLVEADTKVTEYSMNDWEKCVLGTHVFNKSSWMDNQVEVLESFGILGKPAKNDEGSRIYYFSGDNAYELFSDEEAEVMILFTSAIFGCEYLTNDEEEEEYIISKDKWLEVSKAVLEKLKNK